MAYTATVLKVMIATPGDVAAERQIVREVIHDWNDVNAEDRAVVLLPVGWETHSAPRLGGRPQELINKQVLAGCDLLVAVFWTRLGTPTGVAPSGTVEEIEEFVKAGKPAMIYFSSEPVTPESVDMEQYTALVEFKKACLGRGLIERYESKTEFKDKFTRQLSLTVLEWLATRRQNEAAASPDGLRSEADEIAERMLGREGSAVPELSETARTLLLEASADEDGTVLHLATFGGLTVQTNGKQLVEDRSPRTQARWEDAIDQLSREGLLQDRGYKREVFAITQRGYEVADLLRQLT